MPTQVRIHAFALPFRDCAWPPVPVMTGLSVNLFVGARFSKGPVKQ
jgi:hypothetical protein